MSERRSKLTLVGTVSLESVLGEHCSEKLGGHLEQNISVSLLTLRM